MQDLIKTYGVISITVTTGDIIMAASLDDSMGVMADSEIVEVNSRAISLSFPTTIPHEYDGEEHLISFSMNGTEFVLQLGYTDIN